mgnify:CR=1 FL=1|jgi:hypothetical protein
MASVFTEAAPQLKGVWSSNRAGLTGGGGLPLGVVTNVSINFNQQISRMFDLNTEGRTGAANAAGVKKANMYYIGGRAEGQATFGRLIGPGPSGCSFYTGYGDICAIGTNSLVLTFKGSGNMDCSGQSSKYTLTGPILVGVGITQNAQDTMINENAQFMFADMECE